MKTKTQKNNKDWEVEKLGNFIFQHIQITGIFLEILGALSIAVSLSSLSGGGTTNGFSFVYMVSPTLFKIGLIFIILGFIFRLIEILVEKYNITKKDALSLACSLSAVVILVVSILNSI